MPQVDILDFHSKVCRHVSLVTIAKAAIWWQIYLAYMIISVVQVAILLLICKLIMQKLMSNNTSNAKLSSEKYGIPILVSIADLLGTVLLIGAFKLLAASS